MYIQLATILLIFSGLIQSASLFVASIIAMGAAFYVSSL